MSHIGKEFITVSLTILSLLAMVSSVSATTTTTFSSGAYIIDMGQFPYTYATGLKPYGLVYDLVRNRQVPVYWAINPAKAKDGIDFTVDSKSFGGGSLIIPAEYASEALSTINAWTAKGVVVYGPTTNSFSAPIYDCITSFPNTICDLQNGLYIIDAFYLPSELPTGSYRLGNPQDLRACDDIYALPHADPQQWTASQKTSFYNFINNGGFLWTACHAVDAIEGPEDLAFYFQSTNGLMRWGTHSNPRPPYSYNASSATHPIMQFIGRLDNALQTGSERVYLPLTGSRWRSTSTVAVWDPDHPDVLSGKSPGPAGIVIYGRAFGDPTKGFTVYEAGHRISAGNTSENVEGAKVYGNELLLAGILKRPNTTVTAPATILSGQTVNVGATVSGGQPPYTITWTSSIGGTFANPHALSTTFTAPVVTATTTCILRVRVRDNCSRQSFYPQTTTVYPRIMTLNKTDFKSITAPGAINNYTIYYNNTGTVDATSVTLTDRLHPELTYLPTASPSPTGVVSNASGTYLTWDVGTVPAASTRMIKLNASVKDTATVGTRIIDNVTLSYTAFAKNFYLAAQDVDDIRPLTKQVNRTEARAGDYLKYDLCPGYDGTQLLTSAIVKDTIPVHTIYVTGSANASGTYFSGNQTVVWSLGSNQQGTTGKVAASPQVNGFFRNVSINDTDVNANAVTQNDGSCTILHIRGAGTTRDQRTLLYFSLPTLPSFAVFDNALLDVYVTTTQTSTARVHRLTRSWCLHANGQCNCCQGTMVEGIRCNLAPNNNYGATWTNYNSRTTSAVSCPWTTAGGDFDSMIFGTFSASVATRTTADITNLVRGWYNGTYAHQGILMRPVATNQNPAIGSRENPNALDYKPYLNVSYTVLGVPAYQRVLAVNDTYLDAGNAGRNYGTATTLLLNNGAGTNKQYAVVYFTPPTLPGNAVLTSANLDVQVTTARSTNVNVYRLTRDWCLSSNSACGTCCDGKIVEGTVNNAVPSTTSGATWDSYKYQDILACPWTVAGGDYDASIFGTFDLATAGRKTTDISNLVRGWYNGTYSVQGILIDASANNDAVIGSRENTATPDRKPYLNVTYHIPAMPSTNVSISARPLLNCEQSQIRVNMTVNASASVTVTPPASLTVTGTNGATATLASGPSPPGPVTMLANKNYYFNYVYTARPGASPGTLKFTGKPTSSGARFNNSTSNTILITPQLSYKVRIDPSASYTVSRIENNATLFDSSVMPLGAISNTVTTNLTWPAAILASKTVNLSSGSYCTSLKFTINVTNSGKATLNPVIVQDILPAGLNYVSSNGSEYLGTVTWNLGPMTGGQKIFLDLVAHIDGSSYGVLTNQVSANGTAPNGTIVSSQATQSVTAEKASLAVNKSANVTSGAPSTYVNFILTVTNTGQVTLNPVQVQDLWTDGLAYKSSNATSVDLANKTALWSNIGPLSPGQTKHLNLVAHIDGSYFGDLGNVALITGKPPTGSNVTDYNFTTVTALQSAIAVNKTSNVTQGAPSTNVNFSLNVTNTGQVTLSPVKVVDTLPNGLSYVSSNGTPAGNVVTWPDIGPLNAGQSKKLYLVAHINGSAYGVLTNTVNATGTPPTGDSVTNLSSRNVTALRASIAVNKTSNVAQGAPSTNVNFTLNVTNTGQVTLSAVKVVDTIPYGLNYVSSNGTPAGNVVTWPDIGPLNAGQSKKLYLVAHINGSAYGILANKVNVTSTSPTGLNYSANDTRNVTALRASIAVNKTANLTQGAPSSNVNFTLNVTNTGEETLSPVKVVDTIPYGLNYVSSNGTSAGNVVTWSNIGPMSPGQSKNLYLVAHINGSAYGVLTNKVDVTGTPPTGLNHTANDTRSVTALRASIAVNKTSSHAVAPVCTNVTFTLNVTNTGQVILSPVRAVDTIPYGLNYVSSNGTPAGNVVTWSNIGPMSPGQSKNLYLVAHINGSALGNLTNLVNVTGTSPTGLNYSANDTRKVTAYYPNINITKNATPKTVRPGDNVTFIIKVINIGNIPLSTVRVVDVLPNSMVYVSDNRSGMALGNVITWNNLGPLAVNQSTYISLNAKVTL